MAGGAPYGGVDKFGPPVEFERAWLLDVPYADKDRAKARGLHPPPAPYFSRRPESVPCADSQRSTSNERRLTALLVLAGAALALRLLRIFLSQSLDHASLSFRLSYL